MTYGSTVKKTKVIKIDNDHRVYIYERKVTYRERIHGQFITRFSGASILDILESPVVGDVIKGKIRETLKKSF